MSNTNKPEIPLYPDSIEEIDWECKNCNQNTLHIIQKGNLFDGKCSECGWYCYNQIPELYLKNLGVLKKNAEI